MLNLIKKRLGPLGWGTLLVFFIFRANDIAGLVYRFISGRVLAPEDFGATGPLFAFVSILLLPLSTFFQIVTKALSRMHARSDDDGLSGLIKDVVTITTAISVLLIILLWLGGGYVLERLKLDESYLSVLIFLVVTGLWAVMFLAIFQGVRNYRMLAAQNMIAALLLLAGMLIFLFPMQMELAGVFWARALSGIAAIILGVLPLIRHCMKKRKSYAQELALMKEMMLPMFLYWVGINLLLNIDRLFVRNFLFDQSGQYEAVATIGSIPVFFIGSVVFVIFPLASFEHAAGRGVGVFFKQAAVLGFSVTTISVLCFALIARPLLGFWNPEFEPVAGCVWLFALASGINGIIQMIASVELARHRYRFVVYILGPALAMCGFLYYFRVALTLQIVVYALIVTNAAILIFLLMHLLAKNRPACEAGA